MLRKIVHTGTTVILTYLHHHYLPFHTLHAKFDATLPILSLLSPHAQSQFFLFPTKELFNEFDATLPILSLLSPCSISILSVPDKGTVQLCFQSIHCISFHYVGEKMHRRRGEEGEEDDADDEEQEEEEEDEVEEGEEDDEEDEEEPEIDEEEQEEDEDDDDDDNNNTTATSKGRRSSVSSTEEALECLVCGKLFHRGQLDLARHAASKTLQHLYAKTKSAEFSFKCNKCKTYFTTSAHLTMHSTHSSCGVSKRPGRQAAIVAAASIASSGAARKTTTLWVSSSSLKTGASEPVAPQRTTSNSLSRIKDRSLSPKQLKQQLKQQQQQQQNSKGNKGELNNKGVAKTSKNSVQEQEQGLGSGSKRSDQKGVVKSEKKLVTKIKQSKHDKIAAGGSSEVELSMMGSRKEERMSIDKSAERDKDRDLPHHNPTPSSSNSDAFIESSSSSSSSKQDKEKVSDKDNKGVDKETERKQAMEARASKKRELAAIAADEALKKRKEMKRSKVMIPQDRKAYFAVATLLIDQSLIPKDGEKLTILNFEQYVPADKLSVLEKLKEVLLYDC